MTATADEIKACCSASYAGETARFLLGTSFHPGGSRLTRRLLTELRVTADATIADIASGPGSSAIFAGQELGCTVVGVDLSAENVAASRIAAREAGVSERVRFVEGDAEALPFADESADGALCECALCLFPDKRAAAAEVARVLRPGGRLALSDVTADPERLPEELATIAGWAACVADARPLDEIASLLEDAGFVVEKTEAHDRLAAQLVDRVEARLRLARVLRERMPADLVLNVEYGIGLTHAARQAIDQGALGYGIVVARR